MSENVCVWTWTNTSRFFTRLIQWGSTCKTSDQISCYRALSTTTIFEGEFHTCGIPPFCLFLFFKKLTT